MFVLCSYYLERSNSAKITFKRAIEIFPIEVSYNSLQFIIFVYRTNIKCVFIVTEHEKTRLMYTKYTSLYYGTYLLHCLRH